MSQYTIFPIGDSAVTIDFGNVISEELNRKLMGMSAWLTQSGIEGIKDIIIAYSSLSVIYEPALIKKSCGKDESVFSRIQQKITESYILAVDMAPTGKLVRIPVCYDLSFGIDLPWIAAQKDISIEEIIELHTGPVYRVYMIGFLPGFPYMATVDQRISVPRKDKPRQLVKAGSVGVAGKQTGIYPLDTPGGWQIIGRTPITLMDKENEEAFPLRAGDQVAFYSITIEEFNTLSFSGAQTTIS